MTDISEIWVIYSTFATRAEALYVARELLQARLIACANLHENMLAVYRWEGELREESETALTVKTTGAAVERAMEMIRKLHPYTLPCITATRARATDDFTAWVTSETIA